MGGCLSKTESDFSTQVTMGSQNGTIAHEVLDGTTAAVIKKPVEGAKSSQIYQTPSVLTGKLLTGVTADRHCVNFHISTVHEVSFFVQCSIE